MTDTIGLSAKRFIEQFEREVGVTPKRYCRIRRFQRALTLSHHDRRVDWTRVAMDCGYFDQAHFIHDFNRSRASRRLSISQRERRFRTTSNFYNPLQTASETMAV